MSNHTKLYPDFCGIGDLNSSINAVICMEDSRFLDEYLKLHPYFEEEILTSKFRIEILSRHVSPNGSTFLFVKINDKNCLCLTKPDSNLQDEPWIKYVMLLHEGKYTHLVDPFNCFCKDLNSDINAVIVMRNPEYLKENNINPEIGYHNETVLSEHISPSGTTQLFVRLNGKSLLCSAKRNANLQEQRWVEYVALLP